MMYKNIFSITHFFVCGQIIFRFYNVEIGFFPADSFSDLLKPDPGQKIGSRTEKSDFG